MQVAIYLLLESAILSVLWSASQVTCFAWKPDELHLPIFQK